MNLDKQRISAVSALQALGYAWDGAKWTLQVGSSGPRYLSENDFELLCTTIRARFNLPFGDERSGLLFSEIKGWGWFR